MKTISKLFGAVAAIAALAACNKEVNPAEPVVPEGMQHITIKVNTPGTKVTLVDEFSGDLQWSANEELEVKCLGYADTFTLTLNEDGETFSGDIPDESTITDITYPGDPYYKEHCIDYYKQRGAQYEYNFDTTTKFPFPLHWTPAYGGDFENGITLYPDSFAFVRGSLTGVMVYLNYEDETDFRCYTDLVLKATKDGDDYEYAFRLYLNEYNIDQIEFMEYAESDEEEILYSYRFKEEDDKYFTFCVDLDATVDENEILTLPAIHTIEADGTDALLGHTGAWGPLEISAIWAYDEVPMGDGNRYMIYKYAFNAMPTEICDNHLVIRDEDLKEESEGSVSYGFTWGDLNDNVFEERHIVKMNGAEIMSRYYDTEFDEETTYFVCHDTVLECEGDLLTPESDFIDNKQLTFTQLHSRD